MRFQALASLALLGMTAAQAVTEKIAPNAVAPPGCKSGVDGKFEIAIIELGKKTKRAQTEIFKVCVLISALPCFCLFLFVILVLAEWPFKPSH